MANELWYNRFPFYKVVNACPKKSDYVHVILQLTHPTRRRVQKRGHVGKHFQAQWLLEEDSDAVVANAWELAKARGNGALLECLREVNNAIEDSNITTSKKKTNHSNSPVNP